MASTAIITGYSSGLGRAFAEQLLEKGWNVVGVSRNGNIVPFSGASRLIEVRGSVMDEAVVGEVFREAEKLGGPNLVINCAGQGVFGEAGAYSAQDVVSALEGNLAGLIIFSDRAVKHMGEVGGDIINVMSTAAKKLRPNETVYTASKWGAKAYTRCLREAIKSQKLKIRVFEVYPCGMNTSFWTSATRPIADGKSFPQPDSIASEVLDAVLSSGSAYQQEFTFERS